MAVRRGAGRYTVAMWQTITGALSRLAVRCGHIPRGTRVDPAEFPEDDYPVRCLTCGYTPRTEGTGRCSECGAPFERGHLLVEMYVRCRRPRSDRGAAVLNWIQRVNQAGTFLGGALLLGVGITLKTNPDFPLEQFLTVRCGLGR